MSGVALRVVSPADAAVYPLRAGQFVRFGRADFEPGKFLASRLRLLGSADAIAAWIGLWAHAFVSGDPLGTLPIDDAELCALSGLRPHEWAEAREAALAGWRPVKILDDGDRHVADRLTHPDVQAEAERQMAEHGRAAAVRAEAAHRKAVDRVALRMREMGAGAIAANRAVVEEVERRLSARGVSYRSRRVIEAEMRAMGVL